MKSLCLILFLFSQSAFSISLADALEEHYDTPLSELGFTGGHAGAITTKQIRKLQRSCLSQGARLSAWAIHNRYWMFENGNAVIRPKDELYFINGRSKIIKLIQLRVESGFSVHTFEREGKAQQVVFIRTPDKLFHFLSDEGEVVSSHTFTKKKFIKPDQYWWGSGPFALLGYDFFKGRLYDFRTLKAYSWPSNKLRPLEADAEGNILTENGVCKIKQGKIVRVLAVDLPIYSKKILNWKFRDNALHYEFTHPSSLDKISRCQVVTEDSVEEIACPDKEAVDKKPKPTVVSGFVGRGELLPYMGFKDWNFNLEPYLVQYGNFVVLDSNFIVVRTDRSTHLLDRINQSHQQLPTHSVHPLAGGGFHPNCQSYIFYTSSEIFVYDKEWTLKGKCWASREEFAELIWGSSYLLVSRSHLVLYSQAAGFVHLPIEDFSVSGYRHYGPITILAHHESDQGLYIQVELLSDPGIVVDLVYNKEKQRALRGVDLNKNLIFKESGYMKPDSKD